jgi:hypothetical protein
MFPGLLHPEGLSHERILWSGWASLLRSQRVDRTDIRGTPHRKQGSGGADDRKQRCHTCKRERINGIYFVKQTGQEMSGGRSRDQSDGHPRCRQSQAVTKDETRNLTWACTDRDAKADFARPFDDGLTDNGVNPERGQRERQGAQQA